MATTKTRKQPKKRTNADAKAPDTEQSAPKLSADMLTPTSLRPTVRAALTLLEYKKDLGNLSVGIRVDDLVV